MQGVMMLPPNVLPPGAPGADMFRRLWVHEVFRVFYDRLVDDKDREWLMGQVGFLKFLWSVLTSLQQPCSRCYDSG
jgi:hypothetical protein